MSATTTATARRTGRSLSAALAVLGLVAALLLALAPADAAARGTVRGQIRSGHAKVHVQMLWFSKDWTFLGKRKVHGDIYTLSLQPGTYHLQFVDLRHSYDVDKYAPTDVTVRVKGNRSVQKNVRMQPGAAITGTAKAHGRTLGGAKIIAANANQQSYETRTNGKGQFAIGGLPPGSYSVFTFDRAKQYVGKSLWVPGLKRGEKRNVAISLKTLGGSLLIDLRKPDGTKMPGTFFVTLVSDAKHGGSGQFWTAKAKNGHVTFEDIYPGRHYTLVAPGVGNYLARTGPVKDARVKANGADLVSSFTWAKRGAAVQGFVVDLEDPAYPLGKAEVLLFNKAGDQIGQDVTNSAGHFYFGGTTTTQSGLTVVAQPDPSNYSPYLGEGTHYCKYGKTTTDRFSVRTSKTTDIGNVELPHLPAADQGQSVNCYPSDGS